MKKTLLFLLSFFFIHVYGQNAPVMQKKASGNEYHIDFYSAYQNRSPILLMSQFADDIEFVPLETKEGCLLDDFIKDIVVTKDNILVFDYTKCYRFDRKGKFLNSIGVQGNGPGEYVKAMDMVVDTLNQWVYFSDTNANQIVKYDFQGNYLDYFKNGAAGYQNSLYKPMELILENSVYQFAKKGKRFSMTLYSEKEKKVISKFQCDYDYDIPVMALCNPISYTHNGNLYLKDFWCDTIYRMKDPLHLESYVVLERGKFENRTRNDESLVTGKEDVRDRMVLDIGRITETDRYILISGNVAMAYDKKTKNIVAGEYKGENGKLCVEDDLYGTPGIRSDHFPGCVNGNEFYTFRNAYEFIERENSEHKITDTRYTAYQKMVKQLDSEDNPVIMIIKIKK